MKFDFSHFPEEEEIIDEVSSLLCLHYSNGAREKIAEGIRRNVASLSEGGDYLEADLEMDEACLAVFDLLGNGSSLRSMEEWQRDMIAVLWTNYMCEQPYAEIGGQVVSMYFNKIDHKKASMEMIHSITQGQKMSISEYYGCILYLWSLLCLVRSLRRSDEASSSSLFGDLKLNR